jgi:APA family basic amino acid/polyamine antiporter
MTSHSATAGKDAPTLRRALGLWLLTFYGLGTIIGAGIYVLIGEVADTAGFAAPLAFLAAGLLAALTGLCYAELAGRFPEASGAAAYVAEGLNSVWLSRAIGAVVLLTGIVIAASLARGASGYLAVFVDLPPVVAAGALVLTFTVLSCLGVRESVGIAAAMTVIEMAGLVLVIAIGAPALADLPERLPEMWPAGGAWFAVSSGAVIAFFAFIGFESVANMAEEAKEPKRDMPRAILLAIGISTLFYVAVAVVVVLAVPLEKLRHATAPLALVLEASGSVSHRWLSLIALVAILSGILIQVVMSARLLFGMSRRSLLPAWLGLVSHRTRAPVRATLTVGALTFVAAVAFPFGGLVAATSGLTLIIFFFVSLALWRLHRTRPPVESGFRAPRWAPPVAALLCLGLLTIQMFGWLFG